MKKYFLLGFVLSTMTACSLIQTSEATSTPKIGMPNPASQYCIEQGGKLEIKNETNGQVGYCHLPTGQVVEEWSLFRQSQEKCLPEEAQKLIGQSELTDDQVKQFTQSSIIRRIAPGQPVTMDYRDNRITLEIDPTTKKITQAACG